MERESERRQTILAIVVVSAALTVGLAASFGVCTQDDAFISFRYAENFWNGHGLVYNIGQPVEGFTNLSWTLLIALGLEAGWEPVMWSMALGLASLVLGIVACAGLAGAVDGWKWAVVAPVFLAGDAQIALEAVEGLESLLFMAVVSFGLWRLVVEADNRKSHVGSSVLFALALLTRPEGLGVFGLGHIALLWLAWASGAFRLQWSKTWMTTWPVWVTMLGLTVWRLHTYGEWLPNTFYAKSGGLHLVRGCIYVGEHMMRHPVLWGLAVLGGLKGSTPVRVHTVVALGYVAYVITIGGDFKPTGRFLMPILPCLAVLAAVGLEVSVRDRANRWAKWGLLGALGIAHLLGVWRVERECRNWSADRHANLEARKTVGDFLSAQLPPDTLLAIHSAGAIPYFAGFPTIDMWGLTDHHIARTQPQGSEAGHEKSDPQYVFGDNWFGRPPDLYLPEERVFTLKPWSLEPPPNFPDGFVDAYKSVSIAVEGRWLNIWTRKGFLSEAARRGGGQGG